MNKKQKNRKIICQNKRNKLINKRYTSTIKTLSKLFALKVKEIELAKVSQNSDNQSIKKPETFSILKNLYSIIDKAVKKGVIHKNTAARKKSKIGKLYFKIQY